MFKFNGKVVQPSVADLSALKLREFMLLLKSVQLKFVDIFYGCASSNDGVMLFVEYAFAQLGYFISIEEDTPASELDDVENVHTNASGTWVRVTGQMIRRSISLLYCLCLHLYMSKHSTCLPESQEDIDNLSSKIQSYHVESSIQDFYRFSMVSDCMPGSIIQYQQDFRGLYNDISQVVYYNDMNYERRRIVTLDLARKATDPVDALASIVQLYPDLLVLWEGFLLSDVIVSKRSTWLLLSGVVYLVSTGGDIYRSSNIFTLLRAVIGPD
jgi:hypothetical protein